MFRAIKSVLVRVIKKIVRPLIRWYVDPRVNNMRAKNEELSMSIIFLRQEVERSRREISILHQRLWHLENKPETTMKS